MSDSHKDRVERLRFRVRGHEADEELTAIEAEELDALERELDEIAAEMKAENEKIQQNQC
jgi:hypothetical protein